MTIDRHILPGDAIPTDAWTWNSIRESARANRENIGGAPSTPPTEPNGRSPFVHVKNIGLKDIPANGVICLPWFGSPSQPSRNNFEILPSANERIVTGPVFQGRLTFGINRPHGVTIDPIPVGRIGRVVINGWAPVKIYSDLQYPTHAEPLWDTASDTNSVTRMIGGFSGYPIIARETGTGEKWGIINLSEREWAKAHCYHRLGIDVSTTYPFWESSFSSISHGGANIWNSGILAWTNCPHLFTRTSGGLYFNNRDARTFKLTWVASVYGNAPSTQELRLKVVPSCPGPILHHVSENIVGSVGGKGLVIGEASGSAVFTTYYSSFSGPPRLNFSFGASAPGNSTLINVAIRDVDLWIEEIPAYGLATQTIPLSSTPTGGGTTGSAAQFLSAPDHSGTGTGTISPVTPPGGE